MRQVVFTPLAADDLERVWDYIAEHSPANADRYVRRLRSKIELLATLSTPGQFHQDVSTPGVRGYTERSHLILFRLEQQRLIVLRVAHSAQDVSRIRLD